MTQYASLSLKEKREICIRSAETLGVSPIVIEKDLYVCWCLQHLFAASDASPAIIFKGGTSLSKVFGAIERFSEDIDITIDHKALTLTADLQDPTLSKSKIRKLLEEVDQCAATMTKDRLLPLLQEAKNGFPEIQNIEIPVAGTIEVYYQSLFEDQSYILPRILIELGARNVLEPKEMHRVIPYAATHFPMIQFPEGQNVAVLSPVRTFWEKATILHAEYHRPEPRAADRIARHWYDMAMLCQHSIRERALNDIDMLAKVADYKDRIYPSGWASYATARAGSLRLVPHAALSALLQADYESMVRAGFFFSTPPKWAEILARLSDLEAAIQGMGATLERQDQP